MPPRTPDGVAVQRRQYLIIYYLHIIIITYSLYINLHKVAYRCDRVDGWIAEAKG